MVLHEGWNNLQLLVDNVVNKHSEIIGCMIKQVLVNNHLENVKLADNTRRMILQREVEHEQMK